MMKCCKYALMEPKKKKKTDLLCLFFLFYCHLSVHLIKKEFSLSSIYFIFKTHLWECSSNKHYSVGVKTLCSNKPLSKECYN